METRQHRFLHPPASARAHTWWHWNNGNVGREGITDMAQKSFVTR